MKNKRLNIVENKCGASTAYNERFGVIGGVCPPESLCVFASSPPARAVVSRQPRQAATTLWAMRGQRTGNGGRKIEKVENDKKK